MYFMKVILTACMQSYYGGIVLIFIKTFRERRPAQSRGHCDHAAMNWIRIAVANLVL
jgi:hypothetical protein